MLENIKYSLWQQFGASIDMLHKAINLWPDELWAEDKSFFYESYHCIVLLDYYLTVPPPTEFITPFPFHISDIGSVPEGVLGDMVPDRIYSKIELLDYLEVCRSKCKTLILNLTATKLKERWIEEGGDMDYSVLEILLYNMRHVQHHVGHLNAILRKKIDRKSGWIWRVDEG